MASPDKPLIKNLGSIYYKESQILLPLGINKKTALPSGESIVLLIGYDKKKQARGEKAFIQALPILIYLPAEPDEDIMPKNWSEQYIRRIIKEHTNWATLSKTSTIRQFYQRFISEKRQDTNLSVMAQTLYVPMTEDFFESLDFIRVRIYDRLSIVYRYKNDNVVHLADCYCFHTVLPDPSGKVLDEFITPTFISDEDKIFVEPEMTSLGKLTLSCPLDSPHTVASLSKSTGSRFKGRRISYTGRDINTLEDVKIEEESRYQGNDISQLVKVLNAISVLNIKQDDYHRDYICEKSHRNLHSIKTNNLNTKFYTIGDVDVPYDRKPGQKQKKNTVLVSIPYWDNTIVKMFSIKLSEAQEVRLNSKDYIYTKI